MIERDAGSISLGMLESNLENQRKKANNSRGNNCSRSESFQTMNPIKTDKK